MNRQRLFAHKLRNRLQTVLLMALLAALCAGVAWIIDGPTSALLALVMVITLALVNPIASPRLVMAFYRGYPLQYEDAPRLHDIVRTLSLRAGLERLPLLYYVSTAQLNAFSTGSRRQASIAVSDGLLRRLDLRELIGVLAHEIAHIANGDVAVMAFADLVTRITSFLSLAGQLLVLFTLPLWALGLVELPWIALLMLIFAPVLSALVQLALSRTREFEADRTAVELSGDATGLALALGKLEYLQSGMWERLIAPHSRRPDPSLLRSHPPTAERVERLIELGRRERPRLPIGEMPFPDSRHDRIEIKPSGRR